MSELSGTGLVFSAVISRLRSRRSGGRFPPVTMRCFYSREFSQDLPLLHPFQGGKFVQAKDRLVETGVIRGEDIIEVSAANSFVLERVHSKEYLEKIYRGDLDLKEQIELGLPVTPKLFHRSSTEVEATRQACDAAIRDGIAAVLAGGRHHADQSQGKSACVFNDIAIAVRDLQESRPGIRVMVVDTDSHEGDGTEHILADDPSVFLYSLHAGRGKEFSPVTTWGENSALSVETVRYVEGEMYLRQLFSTLAAALEVFSPNLVIWIAGADNHRDDRFGCMLLEEKDFVKRDEVILRAFLKHRIPVCLTFGSGSNEDRDLTVELHSRTVETAARLAAEMRV